ncbi:MAG: hypothetical protein IPJ30_17025 [Acidobacteria bacterium]|nr:hypothetical protein [Acidobacteriota bacterium]
MIYKPNFCCNCGEKIERVEWNFSNSRRFCDVCQTEFFVEDWLPTVLAGVMAMIGLFGVGTYSRRQARRHRLRSASPRPSETRTETRTSPRTKHRLRRIETSQTSASGRVLLRGQPRNQPSFAAL